MASDKKFMFTCMMALSSECKVHRTTAGNAEFIICVQFHQIFVMIVQPKKVIVQQKKIIRKTTKLFGGATLKIVHLIQTCSDKRFFC